MTVRNTYYTLIRNCWVLAALAFFPACTKTGKSEPVLPEGNMAEVIRQSSYYSGTYTAISRSGVDQVLMGTGPFTGFVETDIAWKAAGFNTRAGITTGGNDTLTRAPVDILKAIAEYSFAPGILDSAALPNEVNGVIPNIVEQPLYCTKVPTSFSVTVSGVTTTKVANVPYINGHAITTINLDYPTNGIIHELNEIILPPVGTIAESIDVTILAQDTTLTYLKAALEVASTAGGAGSVDLNTALAGSGPFTLLAPTNAAFRAADSNYTSIERIHALTGADLDKLNQYLQYHVLPERLFSSFWIPLPAAGQSVATLLPGNNVTFFNLGQVKGAGNTANAILAIGIDGNRTCSNGVIHKINAFLKSQ